MARPMRPGAGSSTPIDGTKSFIRGVPLYFVASTDPVSFASYGRAAAWARFQAASYHRAGWGDAYGHLLVATGRVETMLDPVMSPWDCGPFPPILREAGGYFGD